MTDSNDLPPLDRRGFLGGTTGVLASALGRGATASMGRGTSASGPARTRAVALDAFVVFDPRPLDGLAEHLAPGQGPELVARWRTRQFEYGWLRILGGRRADFATITDDALRWAARSLSVELGGSDRRALLAAHASLGPWPDAVAALATLRSHGLRLALLSNFTPGMLAGCISASGLEGVFDRVLSTESAGTFKPDPRAYALGPRALGLPRAEIAFAAHAGWDAAGARWFGFRTFWVNRLGLPREELSATPDATVGSLASLASALVEGAAIGSRAGPSGGSPP